MVSRDYLVSLFQASNSEKVSQAHKDPYTWNIKLSKNLKSLNFIQNVVRHPINSGNYAAAYYQTFEEVPGPLVPEKNINSKKKWQIFLKIA